MQKNAATGLAMLVLAVSSQAVAQESLSEGLSEADKNAFPFPPGEHAALVKETCARCHSANLVVNRTFDEASAERYYKLMVSSDTETEQARKVIQYLSTVLATE